jgi:hypothetical protein
MVFFVFSYFHDLSFTDTSCVIKDLFRFIRVGRYYERKNKGAIETTQRHHAGT